MTAKEFFDLVVELRRSQKCFFKTKEPYFLEESKRLEKQVDDEITRVQQILKDKQEPKLNF